MKPAVTHGQFPPFSLVPSLSRNHSAFPNPGVASVKSQVTGVHSAKEDVCGTEGGLTAVGGTVL